MSKETKTLWVVTSVATITEKVTFDEPVTREEAIALYKDGLYEDVIDVDYETSDIIAVY